MLWISTLVFLVVLGFLFRAVRRRRDADDYGPIDDSEPRWGERFIVVAGVVIPALILGGVYLYSLRQMDALSEAGAGAELEIDVIARDWWWEVRYPNGAITANEIHIPVGEPVRLHLTSGDVMHSFWVPELQAKTDNIPGQDNYMWLQADEPGRYRGQCAEFCGLQHTNMVFYVVADEPEDFEGWVTNEAADMSETETRNISSAQGLDIFVNGSCAGCHAIRGTEAAGTLGPDLTHLMSRETIGGVVPNGDGNLRAFITDPHRFKPGVSMPPTELTEEEIDLIVGFLRGLD